MKKSMKLMADYHCFPTWVSDSSGYSNVDPKTLPLPKALIEKIMSWSEKYDLTLNMELLLTLDFLAN